MIYLILSRQSLVARPSARDDVMMLLIKAVLTMAFVFCRTSYEASFFLVALVVVVYAAMVHYGIQVISRCFLSFITCMIFCFSAFPTLVLSPEFCLYLRISIILGQHLHFYHWHTNFIHCCMTWLLCWASVTLVLVELTQSPKEPGISLLLFILSPIVVLACHLQMQV